MKTLDCESVDSTYASIEEILLIERPALENVLGDLDLEGDCKRAQRGTKNEVLLDRVMRHARSDAPAFDQTCWFHLTRTHPQNSFSKGILPLRDALPFLWGLLLMLLPEEFPLEKWYRFVESPPSGPYHAKLNDPGCWGPFALLPRGAGFTAGELGNRGPFHAPEIVEDICSAFQEEHGFDLLHAYREDTRPCVVTFIDSETRPEHLGTALHYLYRHLHGGPFSADCRVDFDAGGKPIPPDGIRKVEFL